jgi:hypothetical protein
MMRIRKGDLVYYCEDGCRGRGIVSETKGWWIPDGDIELIERGGDLRCLVSRKNITKVVPRGELKEWWKYL